MKGYKAMIRDRCPYVVNLALKWCTEFGRLSNKENGENYKYAVKTRWIERVYKENVAIYTTKDEKKSSLKKALGIHKGKQEFNFASSINLDNINNKWESGEKKFWIWVNSWVVWFQENYKYINNVYNLPGNYKMYGTHWKQLVKNKAAFLDGYLDDFIIYLERTFNKKNKRQWSISL